MWTTRAQADSLGVIPAADGARHSVEDEIDGVPLMSEIAKILTGQECACNAAAVAVRAPGSG
jgi:hypothetical protein